MSAEPIALNPDAPRSDRQRPTSAQVRAVRRALSAHFDTDHLVDDPDAMAPYSTDWSAAKAYPPDLVVRARTTEDVMMVLAAAQEHRIPVTPRGLGTGKAGGALPIYGGIVLSMERMRRIAAADRTNLQITVEPGAVTGDIMRVAESEGLFYPPDPNSFDICSIGGNVACNAGGPRAVKYGTTRDYVRSLQVVLPTGRVVRFGALTAKSSTGYNLRDLMIGSEGTLGIITEITLRLIPRPTAVQTALVSFSSVNAASRAITEIMAAGIVPRTLELLDQHALDAVRAKTPGRFPSDAGAIVILETDGRTERQAFEDLERAAEVCQAYRALDVLLAQDEAQREKIWAPRRVLSMTLKETAPRKISEDIVVPRHQIPSMIAEVGRIGDRHRLRVAAYGHAGDGNLHVNVLFDDASENRAHAAVRDVIGETIRLGGTISGEHGIGLLKQEFLPLEQSTEVLDIQRALKMTMDPFGLLNPGKVLPPG
ncbi:MAG: FAD-linked oxidase C-terminal domain-containing protein [Myxococcota bacterium]